MQQTDSFLQRAGARAQSDPGYVRLKLHRECRRILFCDLATLLNVRLVSWGGVYHD